MWFGCTGTQEGGVSGHNASNRRKDGKLRVANPGNANLPIGVSRIANRENGVPSVQKRRNARCRLFRGGGGVTTAVIFRIMPSDLLRT